jgi:hypothetical protein
MLDDMEQWYDKEQQEIRESNNIFFNISLQSDFYELAINDLEEIKKQWEKWEPPKKSRNTYNNDFDLIPGITHIQLINSWVKKDFTYSSIISMFNYYFKFKDIWYNIDSISDFIKIQREKLKKIYDLINKDGI